MERGQEGGRSSLGVALDPPTPIPSMLHYEGGGLGSGLGCTTRPMDRILAAPRSQQAYDEGEGHSQLLVVNRPVPQPKPCPNHILGTC